MYNVPGPYVIEVTATNECGVSATGSANLTVKARPVPTISGPSESCLDDTKNYTTQTGMTNYVWTVDGGSITSGSGTASIMVKWTSTGSKKVSVNYQQASCPATLPTEYPVTVNSRPSPTIIGDNSACAGESGVIYTTEPGMTGYIWSVQ
jgi:hypothetical protein